MFSKEMLMETRDFIEQFIEFTLLVHDIHNENDKRFASYGLSTERFHIMFFLYTVSELSPSEIADKINVTRASMTGLIDGLEKAQFLERVNHPQDRRKVILKITEKGRDLVEKIIPRHFELVSKVNQVYTEEERKSFIYYLLKMRNILAELHLIKGKDLK
ncbi:DNA-binding transcriptional regulator, MarR family [Paenibacillus sp. yr247]|uniref:MarR family winged helix-turn-helix transcriptional regulator n=1 Tax=Paenibacillus sp. yr247 TaxID=1761880 RepID=UPI000883D304|nr:MarR family transcriptional regulator [Paenibacillus sp. yr247]SDN93808.1 DNA-binding transcriptional regulator, MarR family [Paenibacillus sp. yr247]